MPSLTQELAFISSGVDELEPYLLSTILYWQITWGNGYQSLTIGNLLLAFKRVRPFIENSSQGAKLAIDLTRMDSVRSRMRIAWKNKCNQEINARIGLLLTYLSDYQESPQSEADQYCRQVRSRVIIELISQEESFLNMGLPKLDELDKMITSAWIPGEFSWEPGLKDDFPKDRFWYLYGSLRS